MKKLFLASSFRTLLGDKTLKSEMLKFLVKKPEDILIAHIPNAGDVQENKSYIKETIDQLETMGMKIKRIDLKKENESSLREKFADCDVIFVNGGNTFYLMDIMRKSGFDKVLPNFLDQGKIYIAASAGSYVTCPTIEAATWKNADTNVVNLKDLTGLNLVPFIISAHYDREKYYQALLGGVNSIKLPVVALTDKQAVLVEGDNYKVVGEGERNFFNGFKEVL